MHSGVQMPNCNFFFKIEFHKMECYAYYLYFAKDETWTNVNHKSTREWVQLGTNLARKQKAGKGDRYILCDIGSEDGFLEGATMFFRVCIISYLIFPYIIIVIFYESFENCHTVPIFRITEPKNWRLPRRHGWP